MIIVDRALIKREKNNNPIRVGIIGMGGMGKGLLNQIQNYTPGMFVLGIYNRSLERAKNACISTGNKQFIIADNLEDFQKGIDRKIPVITDNVDLLIETELIDVIVEMTGNISFGLEAILSAFKKGKPVVSYNAELEATLGTYIREQAKVHNVKYTLGDGDQPGVTLNLWRYVKMMGFEPWVCGNIKSLQDHYRNPTTQAAFAKQWDQTPEMVTSFADGTKISFEQSCIANATNMTVAQRGMIGINSNKHVDELTDQFDVDELKALGGIVDYALGAKPAPGVFVYATSGDPLTVKYMKYSKIGDGPLYCFNIPFHLLYFDLASSIARLIDFDDVTLDAEFGFKVEVIAVAKQNLKVGDNIDGIGGYKTYGVCEKSEVVQKDGLIPMGLAEGCVLKNEIKIDGAITWDDVEFDLNLIKFKLYNDYVKNTK